MLICTMLVSKPGSYRINFAGIEEMNFGMTLTFWDGG